MRIPLLASLLALVLVAAACGDATSTGDDPGGIGAPLGADDFPPAPVAPTGPLDPELAADLDLLFESLDLSVGCGCRGGGRTGSSPTT